MNYYNIVIIGSILEPLSYQSTNNINLFSVVDVELRGKLVQGIVIEQIDKPKYICLDIQNITKEYFTPVMIECANFIKNYYFSSLGEAIALFYPHVDMPLVETNHQYIAINLSDAQQKVINFVLKNRQSLIFGDTGSGKTEIYIKLIKQNIKNGKSAIMLLPEISLTPQMSKRLKIVFGDEVAIWHSKITKKKKKEILQKIASKQIKLIAGARSALFLPFNNLGLIIVDEEHDDSYKASSKPRINAKDIAIYYAKILDAKLVLGSATPLCSTYHKIPTIRLKGTYFNSQKEYIYENSNNNLSPFIIEQISLTLQQRQQIIIFVPTRANFKSISCLECAESIKCPYCSVSMSLHKGDSILKCHYCNFTTPIPLYCEKCKCENLTSQRIGTAEVAEQLQVIFHKNNIKRFDSDEIKNTKELRSRLNEFDNKKIDILVGTQMISKGHDYHNVGLSVIIGIDNILHIPDYRSNEKALSTLVQVAGRTGRANRGKILIQSNNINFFKSYIDDYESFIKDELIFRDNLYPPFSKLCRVLFAHNNANKAQEQMNQFLLNLQQFNNIEIIGYGESAINKIANKYRYNILLRSHQVKALLNAINQSKTSLAQIDMDPINFN